MADRVFLHVGVPKSGTTYLQAVLAENKARLRERSGLLYPGESWLDQVQAVRELLSSNSAAPVPGRIAGAWQRLVDQVSTWDGDSVVSMEWLGSAQPRQAQRVVETLAPARVEVIVTVRDLGRTLPAAWQEFMQNYEQWSWQEFLNSVTSEHPRATSAGNSFWSQQDLGRVLAIWSDVVPAEQLHVVTLPRQGATAGELWSRFATVLGIEAGQFDATGGGSNESLGLESAELMRRLNKVSRVNGLAQNLYDEMFKFALAKRGLSQRRHCETTLRFPSELRDWARARTAEQIKSIVASGANIVGDLDELNPVFEATEARMEVTSEALLDAALDGLVAVARDRGEALARLRRNNADLRERERRAASKIERLTARNEQLKRHSAPMRAALVRHSERKPWVMSLRKGYQWGKGQAVSSRLAKMMSSRGESVE